MKIKSMKLSNLFNYGKVEVSFDENITYLIGPNGAGKSTIGINAFWAIMMGVAEKSKTALIGERFRFIGKNGLSASGELVLHDEANDVDITVTRRLTKTSNELSFKAPEGYPVSKEWLESLFNVFLIAPKKFTELSSKQQSEALGIDTSGFDIKIKALKDEYTLINRDLKNIGELVPVEKVERVDVSDLNKQKNEAIRFNDQQRQHQEAIDKANSKISELHEQATTIVGKIEELEAEIERLKGEGEEITGRIEKGMEYINALPRPEKNIDLAPIDEKINTASQDNEKAFLYEQYELNLKKKKATEEKLLKNKQDQAKANEERTAYIAGQKLPFQSLEINEEGELLLQGKPIKEPYFSTGELLKIVPILMSAKNPELKYVFLQDFNLLDEDQQAAVEKTLTEKGMQLVIELVGKKKVADRTCILLRDCKVVEDFLEEKKPELI